MEFGPPQAPRAFAADTSFPTELSLLREARQALAESIPQVAIHKLKTLLAKAELSTEDRAAAALALGQALLASGRHEEALAAIADSDASAARLLRGDVLAALDRWSEALPLYRSVAAEADAPPAARLGEVEALYATGRARRAVELLEGFVRDRPANLSARLRLASIQAELQMTEKAQRTLATIDAQRPGERKWKAYIEARLLLQADQPEPARVAFEEIINDPQDISESLLVGATLGLTEARIVMNGYEAADQTLEAFIWKYPESRYLDRVFQRLDQLYTQQDDPPEGELNKWAKTAPPPRAALARFHLARLHLFEKKPDKAARSLEIFIESFPTHALLPYAHLMQSDLALVKGQMREAIAALEAAARHAKRDELRAEIELRTGIAHHRAGDFLLAANFFDLAGQRSAKLRETALFNSALAALGQKNIDRFLEQYRDLSARFPDSALRSELVLEQGLQYARAGDARAGETLDLFLGHFPKHARAGEARLALAELALMAGDGKAAGRFLQVANELPASHSNDGHAEYLAIFLADQASVAGAAGSEATVIELARQFIRARPESPFLAEVRMKLGQLYFRTSDFPNAETQLATLARESPASPYAEAALFLAAQAAMKTNNADSAARALVLFDEVVKREGGELKLHARQQQAQIQSRLGKEREAIALYEIILAAQPPPGAELRQAALCGKADNLLALGQKEPAQRDAAIAGYAQVAALPEVTPMWRNQALYKMAKAFEQQQRTEEALSTFHDVLSQSAAEPREYFWFYKAGFDAARILEERQEWKSAIGIYEKIAKADGPRADEARALIKQLRLRHFIPWD